MNRVTQTNIKGSKTVNLQTDVFKKLKEIQSKYITNDKVPSHSYIINLLIEKNKKYRRQLKELVSKEEKVIAQ